MIIGAHAILYSSNPEADRAFLKDVIRFPSVDVGGGWLIFGLPPAELAVHPTEDENGEHELFLMCDDAAAFVSEMTRLGVACAPVQNAGWGLLTSVTLPGGGKLGVYQPRHARPKTVRIARRPKKSAKPTARKPARKAATKRKAKVKTRSERGRGAR